MSEVNRGGAMSWSFGLDAAWLHTGMQIAKCSQQDFIVLSAHLEVPYSY